MAKVAPVASRPHGHPMPSQSMTSRQFNAESEYDVESVLSSEKVGRRKENKRTVAQALGLEIRKSGVGVTLVKVELGNSLAEQKAVVYSMFPAMQFYSAFNGADSNLAYFVYLVGACSNLIMNYVHYRRNGFSITLSFMTLETAITLAVLTTYKLSFRNQRPRFSNFVLIKLGKSARQKQRKWWKILGCLDEYVVFVNMILLCIVLGFFRFYEEFQVAKEQDDSLTQILILLTLPYVFQQACGVSSSMLGVTNAFGLIAKYIRSTSKGDLDSVLDEGISFYKAVGRSTGVFKRVFRLNTIYISWQALVCAVSVAEGWITKRPVPLWILLNGIDALLTWLFTLGYVVKVVVEYYRLWDIVASYVAAWSAQLYQNIKDGGAAVSSPDVQGAKDRAKERYARDFLLLSKNVISLFGFTITPGLFGSLLVKTAFGLYLLFTLLLNIPLTTRYLN